VHRALPGRDRESIVVTPPSSVGGTATTVHCLANPSIIHSTALSRLTPTWGGSRQAVGDRGGQRRREEPHRFLIRAGLAAPLDGLDFGGGHFALVLPRLEVRASKWAQR